MRDNLAAPYAGLPLTRLTAGRLCLAEHADHTIPIESRGQNGQKRSSRNWQRGITPFFQLQAQKSERLRYNQARFLAFACGIACTGCFPA